MFFGLKQILYLKLYYFFMNAGKSERRNEHKPIFFYSFFFLSKINYHNLAKGQLNF